jgi:hypothetical protein
VPLDAAVLVDRGEGGRVAALLEDRALHLVGREEPDELERGPASTREPRDGQVGAAERAHAGQPDDPEPLLDRRVRRGQQVVGVGPVAHERRPAALEGQAAQLLVVGPCALGNPPVADAGLQERKAPRRRLDVQGLVVRLQEVAAVAPDRLDEVHRQPLIAGELADVAGHPVLAGGLGLLGKLGPAVRRAVHQVRVVVQQPGVAEQGHAPELAFEPGGVEG